MRVITDTESWATAAARMAERPLKYVKMNTVGQFMSEVTRYFPEFEGFESLYSFFMEPSLKPIAAQASILNRWCLDPDVVLDKRLEIYSREYYGIDSFEGVEDVTPRSTFVELEYRRERVIGRSYPLTRTDLTHSWSSAVEDDVWEFLSLGADRPDDREEFLRVLGELNIMWRSIQVPDDDLRDDGTPWVKSGLCDKLGSLVWNQQLARLKTGRESGVYDFAYQRGLDLSIEALLDGVPIEYVVAGWDK